MTKSRVKVAARRGGQLGHSGKASMHFSILLFLGRNLFAATVSPRPHLPWLALVKAYCGICKLLARSQAGTMQLRYPAQMLLEWPSRPFTGIRPSFAATSASSAFNGRGCGQFLRGNCVRTLFTKFCIDTCILALKALGGVTRNFCMHLLESSESASDGRFSWVWNGCRWKRPDNKRYAGLEVLSRNPSRPAFKAITAYE